MKILKIENGIGYFYSFKTSGYLEINLIDRNSILEIVKFILDNEDYSKDDFKDELINNKAQKIVYKDLDSKINDLINKKQSIIEEIESKYKDSFANYGDLTDANNNENEEGTDE